MANPRRSSNLMATETIQGAQATAADPTRAPKTAKGREAVVLNILKKITSTVVTDDAERSSLTSAIDEVVAVISQENNHAGAAMNWKPVIEPPSFGTEANKHVNAKASGIFICDGDTADYLIWLQRINNACKGFTPEKWLETLAAHSAGRLLKVLTYFQDEYRETKQIDPQEIINRTAFAFGVALNALDAQEKLRKIRLDPKDDVLTIAAKIWSLTEVAVREHAKEDQVRTRELLGRQSFMGCLPNLLHEELKRITRNRAQAGEAEMDFRELTKQAQKLTTIGGFSLRSGTMNRIRPEESDEEGEVNYIPQGGQDTRLGSHLNKYPYVRDEHSNQRRPTYQHPRYTRDQHRRSGGIHVLEIEDQMDGVNLNMDVNVVEDLTADGVIYAVDTKFGRKKIYSGSLGVGRGECLKCGSADHFMNGRGSESCPYKQEPLVARCTSCHKGGHNATLCVRKN